MATAKKPEPAPSTELELTTEQRHDISVSERFSDADLRAVTTFEEAAALAARAYGDIKSITDFELGNGFKLLGSENADRLIGVSFIILHVGFNEGDYNEFASMSLVTQNNDRIVYNGGKAIVDQLKDVVKDGRYGGVVVPHGLRKSTYDTCAGKNCGLPRKQSQKECSNCGDTSEKRAEGKTYYLDTSE